MTRIATHSKIVQFHREIAEAHKAIKGFYRFDVTELTNKLRSGVQTPVLMLESHSTDLAPNANKTVTFANRRISFLLLDFTGKVDNYDKKEQVLDDLEVIALDICSFLKKCSDDRTHWLYGMIDLQTVQIEKVGPILDNMYGWNVIYTLKNHEKMCYDATKWEWNESTTTTPTTPQLEIKPCPHASTSYYLAQSKFINAADESVVDIKALNSLQIIEMWKDNASYKDGVGQSGFAKCAPGFTIGDKIYVAGSELNILLSYNNGYWLVDPSNISVTYGVIQQDQMVSVTSKAAPGRSSVSPVVKTAVAPKLIKVLNGVVTEIIDLPLNQFVLS